jgi:hypothetical protein
VRTGIEVCALPLGTPHALSVDQAIDRMTNRVECAIVALHGKMKNGAVLRDRIIAGLRSMTRDRMPKRIGKQRHGTPIVERVAPEHVIEPAIDGRQRPRDAPAGTRRRAYP